MALRRPSQRSIDLYNQLVAQQNKVRKQLRRIHNRAEEVIGSGRLPALIIPKSARRIKKSNFEGLSSAELHRRLRAYWGKLGEMKALFSKGLSSYLAKTVKDGYMALWRDQIELFSGETPEGFNNQIFTKEQIDNSKYSDFMKTYNKLFMLSPEVFLALLYTGRMLSFKYIYEEMKRVGKGYVSEGGWLQEQNELLNLKDIKIEDKNAEDWLKSSSGPKKQTKIVKEAIEEGSPENAYKSGKHGRTYKGSKKPHFKEEDIL